MNEIRNIIIIAKKEFMDNWRNKWVVAIGAIFLILTLVASYFGTASQGEKVGWSDLGSTIVAMIAIVEYLIPIIALMLGYATIVGEIEKGSMNLLLSYPVSREEVLLGKFIGLLSVIIMAILLGFGVGGLIIAINASINLKEYLIFMFASILLAASYVSISMMFSSLLKRRSTAIGAAIFIWFLFAMIWNMILFGLLVMTHGMNLKQAPDWYYASNILNPIQAFSILIFVNIPSLKNLPGGLSFPSFYNSWTSTLILLIWTFIPLILSMYFFRNRDI